MDRCGRLQAGRDWTNSKCALHMQACSLLLMCSAVTNDLKHMPVVNFTIYELNCNQYNVTLHLAPAMDVCPGLHATFHTLH